MKKHRTNEIIYDHVTDAVEMVTSRRLGPVRQLGFQNRTVSKPDGFETWERKICGGAQVTLESQYCRSGPPHYLYDFLRIVLTLLYYYGLYYFSKSKGLTRLPQ
jgi:hypothetical protein